MAIKRSATSKDSDRARKARLEARVKGTAKGLKTTTGQRRAVVSDIEARRVARTAVGRYPQGKPSRTVRGAKTTPIAKLTSRGAISVSTPMKRTDKTKHKVNPVTVTRTTPKTREEIAKGIAKERYERLTTVLRPTVPPGKGKGGKRSTSYTRNEFFTIAKPSEATTRAKKADPGDRKLDASRKTAMKAANEARMKKTPAERELEQRREKTEQRPTRRSSSNDPEQRKADRRVREGLKEIRIAEEKKEKAAKAAAAKARAKKVAPAARFRGGRGMGGGMIGGGGSRGPVIR
jgi:hypothetical protein